MGNYRHIMPLGSNRRAEGENSIQPSLKEFRDNFNIFTEGSLMNLGKGSHNLFIAVLSSLRLFFSFFLLPRLEQCCWYVTPPPPPPSSGRQS